MPGQSYKTNNLSQIPQTLEQRKGDYPILEQFPVTSRAPPPVPLNLSTHCKNTVDLIKRDDTCLEIKCSLPPLSMSHWKDNVTVTGDKDTDVDWATAFEGTLLHKERVPEQSTETGNVWIEGFNPRLKVSHQPRTADTARTAKTVSQISYNSISYLITRWTHDNSSVNGTDLLYKISRISQSRTNAYYRAIVLPIGERPYTNSSRPIQIRGVTVRGMIPR